MLSFGTLFCFAFAIKSRSLLFAAGSAPPSLTQTMISLPILVKTLARWASVFPFLCIMFFHFECPDIVSTFLKSLHFLIIQHILGIFKISDAIFPHMNAGL